LNNQDLDALINSVSDSVEGGAGHWQFIIKEIRLICLTDELHNRMRFIAPIAKVEDLSSEYIFKSMEANFHTALDARYAISDGVMWSCFIHPLRELGEAQALDALKQVYSSAQTFGSTYSGGSVSFMTNDDRRARDN